MSTAYDESVQSSGGSPDRSAVLTGILHIYVAFDWGEELDLARARELVPAETQMLSRRRRTPPSIGYRPAPLWFPLKEPEITVPGAGSVKLSAEAAVFDFGGLSVGLRLPFSMTAEGVRLVAAHFADPTPAIEAARMAVEPLYNRLLPAILHPVWSTITEEYFVFQFPPGPPLPSPTDLIAANAPWLASLVRLEPSQLSVQEVQEAVRLNLSYTPEDLFVPDWAAAVLVDTQCEETLQTIEFVNLLLLEFRHLDERLDKSLGSAYKLIHPLARSRLPLLRSYHRPLRALGELKVEAATMLERSGNVLKLMGDQYIARVYILLSKRFHLEDWEQSIRRSLDVVEGVYSVISDQSTTYRTELLEAIIVVLILFEILMAFLRH